MRGMIGICLYGVLTGYAIASSLTIAEQEKQYKDNLAWAQSAQQGITSKTNGHLDIADYCDGVECVNQVNNPSQKGLSHIAIDDQKTSEFLGNDAASSIQDNFNKGKPDITSDPTYQFALIGQEHAFEITHGISNQYVDCQSSQLCVDKQVNKSCHAPTHHPVSCFEEPYVAHTSINNDSITFSYSGLTPVRYTLPPGVTEITGITFPPFSACQSLNCKNNGGTFIRVNNTTVRSLPYPSGTLNIDQACRQGGNGYTCWYRHGSMTVAMNLPTQETLTIDLHKDLAVFRGTFTVHYKARTHEIGWRQHCSMILPECNQIDRICIEPEETRLFNGISTHLDCWKYELKHQCDFENSCDALNECTEQSRSCGLQLNGVCVEEEITKTCHVKECSSTSLQCGEQSFCLDGDCYEATPTPSDDFNQAASSLAALAQAAEGLGDPPKIFSGKGMMCTDKAFGFADCCKDGGWGTSIGLGECDEEEKALGQAKEQGVTIYLGSYCADKVLGACIRKKKSYCVFDSKLARIIQQQGVKGQLGINLGSAENPLCDAITPEQLQHINFEYIDFSDFYDDMHDSANLPSATEIQNRLQSAYDNE